MGCASSSGRGEEQVAGNPWNHYGGDAFSHKESKAQLYARSQLTLPSLLTSTSLSKRDAPSQLKTMYLDDKALRPGAFENRCRPGDKIKFTLTPTSASTVDTQDDLSDFDSWAGDACKDDEFDSDSPVPRPPDVVEHVAHVKRLNKFLQTMERHPTTLRIHTHLRREASFGAENKEFGQ